MFINMASVLHCFDIGPPLDDHGEPMRIAPEWTDGLASCVFVPSYVFSVFNLPHFGPCITSLQVSRRHSL